MQPSPLKRARRVLLYFDRVVAIFACITFVECNIGFTIRPGMPWFVIAVPLLTMPLCLAAMMWLKELDR